MESILDSVIDSTSSGTPSTGEQKQSHQVRELRLWVAQTRCFPAENSLIREIGGNTLPNAGIITEGTHKHALDESVHVTSHEILEKLNGRFFAHCADLSKIVAHLGIFSRQMGKGISRPHHSTTSIK